MTTGVSSFRNRKRAAQLIDFEGLSWGKLRPTDIDLSLDWQGKTFVFVELKSGHAALTMGQRIHLEGLVRAITKGGKTAYAIYAQHDTPTTEDVMAKDAVVNSIFNGMSWSKEDTGSSLHDILNKMHETHLEEQSV